MMKNVKIKNQDYSTPISAELSDFLRRYTNSTDWAETCIKTKVGTSTIRDLIYRTNSLTKRNSKAIIHLIEIAKKRASEIAFQAKEDMKKSKQFILVENE